VNVQVTNTDSQSGTLSNGFTYRGAPTVTNVSPNSGKLAGGTAIIITGTGFLNGATVNVGASACTGISVVSSTQITCTTPSGAAGAVAVSVINSDAQSGSLAGGFTYTAVALIEFQVGAVSPNPPNPDTYGSTTTNITHTFTVRNTGESVSTALSVFLSGASPAAYSLGTDTCNGNTLAVGATCTIQLTFLGGFMGTGTYNAVLNTTATSGGTTTNVVTGSVP
jgi:hypothetical protein